MLSYMQSYVCMYVLGWSTFFNFLFCHGAPLQKILILEMIKIWAPTPMAPLQKMYIKFHPNHCIFTGRYQPSKEHTLVGHRPCRIFVCLLLCYQS